MFPIRHCRSTGAKANVVVKASQLTFEGGSAQTSADLFALAKLVFSSL